MLRKKFGPKRDEGTGQWKRLHSEELYDLHSSPKIIQEIKSRAMRWVGHVACMEDKTGTYTVLVERPVEKRPLERPNCRCENNIKMHLQGVGWGGVNWTDLAQDRDLRLP